MNVMNMGIPFILLFQLQWRQIYHRCIVSTINSTEICECGNLAFHAVKQRVKLKVVGHSILFCDYSYSKK